MNKLYEDVEPIESYDEFEGFHIDLDSLKHPSKGEEIKLPEPDPSMPGAPSEEEIMHELDESPAHLVNESLQQRLIIKHLREATLQDAIKKFIAETDNDSEITVDNFKDKYPEEADRFGNDEKIYQYLRGTMKTDFPERSFITKKEANKAVGSKEEPKKVFDSDKASEKMKRMMGIAAKAQSTLFSSSGSVEAKYDKMNGAAYSTAAGRQPFRHLLVCGDPGIGKTHDVVPAIQRGNAANKNPKEFLLFSGSVGKSLSAILAFFYPLRAGKMIVLDDADGFLQLKNDDIDNFLKALFENSSKDITMDAYARVAADRILAKKRGVLDEGVEITINKAKLREGTLSVQVGETLIETSDPQEVYNVRKLMLVEKTDVVSTRGKMFDIYGRRLSEAFDPNEWGKEAEDDDKVFGDQYEEEFVDFQSDDPIPEKWNFTSSVCMISNLDFEDVNDAVLSRFIKTQIKLTREEFMYRLGQVLPFLEKSKHQNMDEEEWQWVKREVFALLQLAIEADATGAPLDYSNAGEDGTPEAFAIPETYQMQFRLIYELSGLYTTMADAFSLKYNTTDREIIANGIEAPFLFKSLIPTITPYSKKGKRR